MVTASQRRGAVDYLKSRRFSERRACKLAGLSRSVRNTAELSVTMLRYAGILGR